MVSQWEQQQRDAHGQIPTMNTLPNALIEVEEGQTLAYPTGGHADAPTDARQRGAGGNQVLVGPGFVHWSQVGTLPILDELELQLFDWRQSADDHWHVQQTGAPSSGQAPVAGNDGASRGDKQRLENSTLCSMGGNGCGQLVDACWIELATRIQRIWPQVSQWPACCLSGISRLAPRSKRCRAGVVAV